MAKTAAEMIRGAFARAHGRTAAVHYIGTSAGGYAAYSVDSSRDVDSAYTVTVSPAGRFACTCPSELRPACWHRAAVASVRASRQGFGLPVDGPSAEETRAAAVLAEHRPEPRRSLSEIAAAWAA